MLRNMTKKGALLGLGMFATTSVHALGFSADILADNEVSAWQLINHTTLSIEDQGTTPTAQLAAPDTISASSLAAGDYSLVFALTNWTGQFDMTPAPADEPAGNWVGFLAQISSEAGTVMSGPSVSNASWDSNLANSIPDIADAIATPGTAGWSNTSEIIANNGEGIWGSNPIFGQTGFSSEAKWIWAEGDTDGQVLVRAQFKLSAVPIPAAGILFFSAIAGLITMGRRRNTASSAVA